jgi:hypothetical protein
MLHLLSKSHLLTSKEVAVCLEGGVVLSHLLEDFAGAIKFQEGAFGHLLNDIGLES